ncbi:hypothetical protein [Bradyrhizobium australiense]|uniref:Uncharacterized protein n=1 Tax=Bradyrhizobium australiense TaxID=2721161 RepID=A0A7Y4GYZ7_9BRAD|nr:hypothetical protein [Bradyrhizobium australiense]NOJ44568.1 hypothetical protein [Bradyrhizobium australiense]
MIAAIFEGALGRQLGKQMVVRGEPGFSRDELKSPDERYKDLATERSERTRHGRFSRLICGITRRFWPM